ncbi:hypothetical protein EN836_30925 [Mesorhizobium sp. M1C.F.Ca.ET.193.01.1.1]|uniref:hypothetical protein n=1 Tax=unclassified Mesorhizobium TaxID=325217 RepID=UPI000FD3BACF|nr:MULTISPECIES: hypothetical protein [unclassified Mesorhizobium]TGS91974.1 hypothetical protein EN820_51585 [bacterium M00.F.Ca.ET.177.01.1.1]TGQ50064.1 hypothetical protein EN853_30915 [Mesorhizobium sp. M1C.F.Ca.ET.210.01.1.1]TGQ64758.1 hypothetical protein EN855_030930 [Mesorhizobium sp. M1C.F.Ca.ET.212.01.1.1]TGQ98374.1 hypothetical protein EN847_30915 [Mesorhizobium sp. M1C.F.Ca.ET.204.01.1.1]TGR18679.1 hypothetical protein EN839_30915 [Mesorhizobium sp. M1C.F.Ca.ET.196.01.1.1]
MSELTTAGLWLAVIASGIYHGINPGMGWPLAVSAALLSRRAGELFRALGLLAMGHFAAMIGILLPFGAMLTLFVWERQVRIGAGLIVIAAGIYLLINRRHPRVLARIPPGQLALWSFAAATAHGAGLMLVPIYLGLCQAGDLDAGHQAGATLMTGNLITAAAVSVVHTAAMIASGGVIAIAVYRWLGPKFVSQSWFNLDIVWAVSLILVGGIGIASIGYAR